MSVQGRQAHGGGGSSVRSTAIEERRCHDTCELLGVFFRPLLKLRPLTMELRVDVTPPSGAGDPAGSAALGSPLLNGRSVAPPHDRLRRCCWELAAAGAATGATTAAGLVVGAAVGGASAAEGAAAEACWSICMSCALGVRPDGNDAPCW